MKRNGFTLIEMLMVIAIIAILTAIILPTVSRATVKASAAADAANMRSVYGVANAVLYGGQLETALKDVESRHVACKSFPDAKMEIVYQFPAFVDVYFVDGEKYYSMDYLCDMAQTGSSDRSTAKPELPDARWAVVGEKNEINESQ